MMNDDDMPTRYDLERRAHICRELAQVHGDPSTRQRLLRVADEYEMLASKMPQSRRNDATLH
jgi:hypothetical protein